jgi:predicted MFS family arabinose efflux permease
MTLPIPAALRHRNFALYWSGQVVSLMGTFMQAVALGYLVYGLTHSKALLGLITVLQLGPSLLFGLPSGVLADRVVKRSLLLTTQSTALVLALALATLTATRTLQVWEILVIMSISGLAIAVEGPTRQSFVVDLVGMEDLPAAIGLNSVSVNLARVLGPAAGGLAVQAFGAAPVFYYNAFSFLAVICALLLMRDMPTRAQNAARRPLAQLIEGLQFIRASNAIGMILLMIAVVGVFGFNFQVLMPILARDTLHTDASGLGWMWAALGLGAVLGGATVIRWSRQAQTGTLLPVAAVAVGAFDIGASFGHSMIVVIPMLIGAGWGSGAVFAGANTAIQARVDNALRGRVLSVYTMVFTGSAPLGAIFASSLASAGGPGLALLAGGVLCLAACGIFAIPLLKAARPPAGDAALTLAR